MKFKDLDKSKNYMDSNGDEWEFINESWNFLDRDSSEWIVMTDTDVADYMPFTEIKKIRFPKCQEKATSVQVDGSHYKEYVIQPFEFFSKNKVPHGEACAIKYLLRHKNKNGIKDLQKAKHYIDLIIEMEYPNE